MQTKEQTCEERITSQLEGLNEDLEGIFSRYDGEDNEARDEAFQELAEYPLCIEDPRIVTIITLSWGGPSSRLEVTHDKSGDIYEVLYRFSDWFDTATQEVEKDSAAWRYAAWVLEGMEF